MEMVKRVVIFLFMLVLLANFVNAALGITPAIVELKYVPGTEVEIPYTVLSDNEEREIEITLGESEIPMVLSKKRIVGAGGFNVKVKFPEEKVGKPGENRIGIRLSEIVENQGSIGTAITVSGVIIINVPFPGRYAEGSLKVNDGNINEQVPVEVNIINRGREVLDVNTNIGFYDDGNVISFMTFDPITITSGDTGILKNNLDTTGMKAGRYFAEAVINYGADNLKVNQTFRIGSLFVNITNFTEFLPTGQIQKFNVDVESMWNNNLHEVYADINISNSTFSEKFRTPSIELKAWEAGNLVGFLDTTDLDGKYNSEIELYYDAKKTTVKGKLLISEGLGANYLLIGIIAIVLIIVIIIVVWIVKKRKSVVKK